MVTRRKYSKEFKLDAINLVVIKRCITSLPSPHPAPSISYLNWIIPFQGATSVKN